MKKIIFGLILALSLAVPSFAQNTASVDIFSAIGDAAEKIAAKTEYGKVAAIVNFSAPSKEMSEWLESEMVKALSGRSVKLVDRSNKGQKVINQEIEYQYSGVVSDDTIAAYGQQLGARYIIYGSFEQFGGAKTFDFRMTDVETYEIIAAKSYNIANSAIIKELLGTDIQITSIQDYIDIIDSLNAKKSIVEREMNKDRDHAENAIRAEYQKKINAKTAEVTELYGGLYSGNKLNAEIASAIKPLESQRDALIRPVAESSRAKFADQLSSIDNNLKMIMNNLQNEIFVVNAGSVDVEILTKTDMATETAYFSVSLASTDAYVNYSFNGRIDPASPAEFKRISSIVEETKSDCGEIEFKLRPKAAGSTTFDIVISSIRIFDSTNNKTFFKKEGKALGSTNGGTINMVAQKGGTRNPSKKLVVWSFTDEIQTMINKYYKPTHSDIQVEFSLKPTEKFASRLDSVLASGKGIPDVIALEDGFVRKYIEQADKYLLDLTDEYNAVKKKMIAYPAEVGSYNGHVYGVSWQACPGAMFYRRSLAKKYLGTDEPEKVQKLVANWSKFLATARKIRDKSNGSCVMLSTSADLFKPFLAARKGPWIQGGKLVVDPMMIEYLKMCKLMRDEGLDGRTWQWSDGWFAGMKGALKSEDGNPLDVFAYFLPTWGLHFTLKPNCGFTSGDWAMCAGPSPYRWGGTWLAAYKGTKNPDLAKKFLMYIATDDGFLEKWARDTGDMVSNNNVINKVKDSYVESFLGGQNHYAQFATMVNNIDGKLTQGTDQVIESLFGETVGPYIYGGDTIENVINEFKRRVSETIGL